MGNKKAPNKGTVPCLVCMNRLEHLESGHLSSSNCESGEPTDVDSYRNWVADEFDVSSDDALFEKNQIQTPQQYRKHAQRLGLPK
jgi:hypothetical protein